ncbi:glycosyltransferase 87 family protein [Streptomyces sodiiphilus]|uniref:Glycosyltransferase 87 family protein n=1 Tax=Streptomyces sodiiphilus TaxID=226217 RepID=A0ABN2PH31_9ACTN
MAHTDPRVVVRPTSQDEVAAAGSELIGGPAGRRTADGTGWWNPVRVIALVMIGMFSLGMVQKLPCWNSGWFHGPASQYTHACYSDIPHLYGGRGFADGLIPYFDRIPEELSGGMEYLEYPVLTGLFMEVAVWLTPSGDTVERPGQYYWLVNAAMLMICAVVIAVCVARIQRGRPWDGLMVALAPAFALTATINWDLLAGALTCAALLMWSRGRPAAAGILIGLATAAKLYPLLLLGPLFLLCLRAGRLRSFAVAATGAAASWLAVNLPVMTLATEGWATFYTFSRERPVDFGSLWLVLAQRTDLALDPERVNTLATGLTLLGCALIGLLALTAPRRPRLAQLAFLTVAVFILFNKVYSPQYVLWLIPLAVLARPRWRDFLIWQTCEVLYFLGIWMYLAYTTGDQQHGLPAGGYQLAIVVHLAGTAYLCLMVVRDALRPRHDPVRWDGSDDPGGGVLDSAPDAFRLRRRSRVRHPRQGADWGARPTAVPTGAGPDSARDVSRET